MLEGEAEALKAAHTYPPHHAEWALFDEHDEWAAQQHREMLRLAHCLRKIAAAAAESPVIAGDA